MTGLTFGSDPALCDVEHARRVLTFRATVEEGPQKVIMKLEGRIAGPWVEECRRAWVAVAPALPAKKLCLDLCGVTFVDACGTELLREIYGATGARIVTNSPLTKHFAEQAMQEHGKTEHEGA